MSDLVAASAATVPELAHSPQFSCDYDGMETYAAITVIVGDDDLAMKVIRQIVVRQHVRIHLRAEKGVIPELLRRWADKVEKDEAPK